MHTCPCCDEIIYCSDLLCDDCQAADCTPNGSGNYDDCQRDCRTCGDPGNADFYVSVVWEDSDGETQHSDGYVCAGHLESDTELSWFVSSGATILEENVTELDHCR